ncbi:hypothetical protein CEXT_540931 [Caerostris extrusa]|uniref:Uncharacterized protein n=1 Tax=Caerostris extrusa TaxID=172846 RepID=A0AAV4NAS4_CAEEX|nr:hypothetical protein CEXT_540931 [Caerostris extrusa]
MGHNGYLMEDFEYTFVWQSVPNLALNCSPTSIGYLRWTRQIAGIRISSAILHKNLNGNLAHKDAADIVMSVLDTLNNRGVKDAMF